MQARPGRAPRMRDGGWAARGSPRASLARLRRAVPRGNGLAACLGRPGCLCFPVKPVLPCAWASPLAFPHLGLLPGGRRDTLGPNPGSDFHCTPAFIRTLKQGPWGSASVMLWALNWPQPLPPEQKARKRGSGSPLPGSLPLPSGRVRCLRLSTACLLVFLTPTHQPHSEPLCAGQVNLSLTPNWLANSGCSVNT